MVRGKFKATTVKKFHWGGAEITFDTVYDSTIPEDQRFMTATPSGQITMQVNNPAALEQLKLGSYFYVDFSEVPAS